MTDEMIDYASGDVTAMIPEVYEYQKRYFNVQSGNEPPRDKTNTSAQSDQSLRRVFNG